MSCSNSQIQLDKLSKQINIVDTQAWINLMPGGPGSFHITGEYEIDKTELEKLSLRKIIVYSENQIIYDINTANLSNELQADEKIQKLKYRFNIQPGLKLNDSIKIVETIDIKLIFEFNGREIEKMINDVYLTRAY
ncbi:MAG: hypothetical protein IT276_15995 [Ignavibacteriaceae bacterium]|nr:hypothetical protein [Ignavibacterium sp.]MCC6256416.1 hypothetical protein [Ignavibacteriaceae bacterium]HRN25707.1 hypothetical protein [Ignavibacteriaceae bacterium]HRP93702.1 hypothetical protein [Ignavibacteriaceae bacterium]HRQ53387.1 hypothetical protein [Ignavibacteriaceae bacterium]